MLAVGIDVSNGRSTVAVLQSKTKVTLKPFEVAHTAERLNRQYQLACKNRTACANKLIALLEQKLSGLSFAV